MVDGFSVLTGSVGIIGVAGGVVSTIAALRTSGARRHVERAQGASSMLAALDALPTPDGGRLVTPGQENELRDELGRIVRENAAAYVKQNPTPVGVDFARVLMPGYFLYFGYLAVRAFVTATHGGNVGDWGAAWIFTIASVAFLVITGLLSERMARRNDARRLAGTPGQERYFAPLLEVWQAIVGPWQRHRARRKTAGAGH
jgi:hypothetical protein